MTLRIFSTASAAALAIALAVAPAQAEELGVQQLQDSATASLAQLGMDTSMIGMLSLVELAQIEAVSGGGDAAQTKVARIEIILRDAEARIAAGGAVGATGATGDFGAEALAATRDLESSVAASLARLGFGADVAVGRLSAGQLGQIELVTAGGAPEAEQRAQIERILAN